MQIGGGEKRATNFLPPEPVLVRDEGVDCCVTLHHRLLHSIEKFKMSRDPRFFIESVGVGPVVKLT